MPLTEVWSIFEDSRSNLWVGTSSHGVYQFRDGRFVPMFDQSRISHRVNAIHEDRQGRIWFGHWGGLACYADGQLTRVAMPWLSDEYEVVAIASDARDRLWLGTKGAGCFCLQDGKFTSYTKTNGLPSNLAWSLFVDRNDALWIGTADGGLSCLSDGRFVNFTPGMAWPIKPCATFSKIPNAGFGSARRMVCSRRTGWAWKPSCAARARRSPALPTVNPTGCCRPPAPARSNPPGARRAMVGCSSRRSRAWPSCAPTR
jgi:ligand-binding sensor domain-containing protein